MDRSSSPSSAHCIYGSQPQMRKYQINHGNYSESLHGTFRSPPQYSEWSLPSSTEPEWANNDFDASSLSTCSPTNLETPSWDGNYNPFDICFSKDSLPVVYDAGAHQTWLATSTLDIEQSHLGRQQVFSANNVTPNADFRLYQPARPVDTATPVMKLPINIIPSRNRNWRISKSPNKGMKDKRANTKTNCLRGDTPSSGRPTRRAIDGVECSPANVSMDDECGESSNIKLKHSKGEEDKERHKHVEMKYRMQMKDRFEELLQALPEQNKVLIGERSPRKPELDKKMTRGKVLDLAKEHIDALDRTRKALEKERDALKYQVSLYEAAWLSRGLNVLEG